MIPNLDQLTSLRSARTVVRRIVEADLKDLMVVNSDPEVTRFLPYASWNSLADASAWLSRMDKLAASGTGQQFVLETIHDRKVVGTVLLFRLDAANGRAEIGYVLGRHFWGRGLMSEGLRSLCTFSFDVLKLRRLEAEVQPSNDASHSLLSRLGFVKEGLLWKRWMAKGSAYDTNIYGLLSDDWQT